MGYYFKTQGREYHFQLNDKGLLECGDLNLEAPTLDELKALVTEAVKKEKAAPRIPVIVLLEDRTGVVLGYFTGLASSKPSDRYGSRWVTYTEKEKTKRKTFNRDSLYLDTPENRVLAARMIQIGKEITVRLENTEQLQGDMERITGDSS